MTLTLMWLMPGADERPLLELTRRDNPVRLDGHAPADTWPARQPHRHARIARLANPRFNKNAAGAARHSSPAA